MRIAHIADVHIRNYKYHKEYRAAFEDLYGKLREQKPDIICVLGDIAHTKTDISPEFVEMTTNFFVQLGNIAPTKIILGNHDLNLKNKERQDAITPIIAALDDKNVELWKYSGGEQCGFYVNCENEVLPVNFNVLSVLDPENWQKPKKNAINIALYHGSISGCKVDNGWVMEKGDNELNCFDGHDLVLLGDIHKRQKLDKRGRIAYPGSLIQQNFAEDVEKGFLIWDIKDKNNMSSNFIPIKNIKPFINVVVKNKAINCENNVIKGARVRLVINEFLTEKETQEILEQIRVYSPESVVIQNNLGKLAGILDAEGKEIERDDLLATGVQDKFLREFLNTYDVNDEKIDEILELNKKYNYLVAATENAPEQIQWDIDKIEWNNFFNYDSGNEINFKDFNGIVGVFGKNYSGKSSVIDTLLFTIFNNSTKNIRKNINYINYDKDQASAKAHIRIGNESYIVERKLEKYKKSGKFEAKSEVHFANKSNKETLNQLDKKNTDKQIQKVFGNFEDFLLTSVSSQLNSLSFINEGTTRRREVLSRFLGLDIFSKINDLIKVETRDLKGALKKISLQELDEKIYKNKEQIEDAGREYERVKIETDKQRERVHDAKKDLLAIKERMSNIDISGINISELEREEGVLKSCLVNTEQKIKRANFDIDESGPRLEKIRKFLDVYDYDNFLEKKEKYEEISTKIRDLSEEERRAMREINLDQNRIKTLAEVPCGGCEEFATCRFIIDAIDAKENIAEKMGIEEHARMKRIAFETVIEDIDIENESVRAERYKKCQILEKELLLKVAELKVVVKENKTIFENTQNKLNEIMVSKKKYYEDIENETKIEKLKMLQVEKGNVLSEAETLLEQYNQKKEILSRNEASISGVLTALEEEKARIKKLQEDYEIYDLYSKATSSSGIPFAILKNNLPLINEQVNNVLGNIVDFKAYFVAEDNRLEILLKHPGDEPRPIELGSGAEKTLVSIAIRIALTNFSNLPKTNFFILDEPGTTLDAENLRAFDKILQLLRQQFRFTLLITHISEMKDSVDKIIEVGKNNKYAHIKA
jgi:DNA repair exonuclease SbcCD ATPase subunit